MESKTLIAVVIALICAETFAVDIPIEKLRIASSTTGVFLKENIVGRALPDVNFKQGYVKNIKITGVEIPDLTMTNNGDELLVTADNLGISVEGNYRIKFSWIYRESGTATASVSNVDVSLPVSLNPSSFLQADRSRCRDSIGSIRYSFKGGLLGKVANILRGPLSSLLRNKLRGEVCDAITKAINNNRGKLTSILN